MSRYISRKRKNRRATLAPYADQALQTEIEKGQKKGSSSRVLPKILRMGLRPQRLDESPHQGAGSNKETRYKRRSGNFPHGKRRIVTGGNQPTEKAGLIEKKKIPARISRQWSALGEKQAAGLNRKTPNVAERLEGSIKGRWGGRSTSR